MKEKRILGLILILILLIPIPLIIKFISTPIDNADDKNSTEKIKRSGNQMLVGVASGPHDLDPHNSWDTASWNVQINVVEGLFEYNYSDPEVNIIPRLATGFGTWSGSNYTVNIRSGIYFHDGSLLTADDVVWSFNRLANLMSLGKAAASSLYEYYDPILEKIQPIINKTVKVGEYSVKFALNTEYGPFEALLCFMGSKIIAENSAPFDDNINITTDDLIGTGPFNYISYTPDIEVQLEGFDNYWRGAPKIKYVTYLVISDPNSRDSAMLAGNLDLLLNPQLQNLGTFNMTNGLTLHHAGSDFTTSYLGMNNKKINVNVRKAISYAVDYDYILENILNGYGDRLKSPVPQGIQYSNYSFNVANYNITKARMAMQDAGYGVGHSLTDDGWWQSQIFLTYNYTYNIDNSVRENILYLLQDNLDAIGIEVTDAGVTWNQFLYSLYEIPPYSRDDLDLFWLGWIADYNDASNYLNPLFTNRSIESNYAQVNDPQVQLWMEEALIETDTQIRQDLYNNIQKRLVEEVYPWAFGFTGDNYDVWKSNLIGFPSNHFDRLYLYPCELLGPDTFELSSTAEKPIDTDGSFNLTWAESAGADNYTVYRYDKPITSINGSLTVLAYELTNLNLTLNSQPKGIFYFSVEAKDQYDSILSNCIEIAINPEMDSNFTIEYGIFDGLQLRYNYSVEFGGVEQSIPLDFEYLKLNDILFNVSFTANLTIFGGWQENVETRMMNNTYGANLGDSCHTPLWIPTNIKMGYYISISNVMGVDQFYEVVDQGNYNYFGNQMLDYWELHNLRDSSLNLWYEKSSGILLNGTFGAGDGLLPYSYKLRLMQTNDPSLNLQVPGAFTLSSDAGHPDDDGNFTLSWTDSQYANNYTVYRYDKFITEINGSLIKITDQTYNLNHSVTGYQSGIYYFIVEAINENGETLSNCIEVIIIIEPPPDQPNLPGPFTLSSNAGHPDGDGNFTLSWTASEYADDYAVYRHDEYITQINGSVTKVNGQTSSLSYSVTGYQSGIYYFIIEAINEDGETLSNCIEVIVIIETPPDQPSIPGYNILFLGLSIFSLISISLILIRRKRYF
ncbi:MAG: ABC transporter substrate-binding protein [Candidatus Lokiarchaeota archaeon]